MCQQQSDEVDAQETGAAGDETGGDHLRQHPAAAGRIGGLFIQQA
jgi:hypothetical protein